MNLNLLITIAVVLIVVGSLVWLIMQAPFIDATWKAIIKYTAIVVTVVWLLRLFVNHMGVHL